MLEQIIEFMTNTAGMSYKRMLFALLFSTGLSLYIYIVYRGMAKQSFYSKSFNITLPIITILTTAIVVAMQANLVVSLGMVGALSIVRFRTAIKDPMDLGFVFWGITVGIISGTEIYGLAILTSLIITIAVLALQKVPMKEAPHLLIINGNDPEYEKKILPLLKKLTSRYEVKSRNMRKNSLDVIIEIKSHRGADLIQAIKQIDGIEAVSILNHDGSMRY